MGRNNFGSFIILMGIILGAAFGYLLSWGISVAFLRTSPSLFEQILLIVVGLSIGLLLAEVWRKSYEAPPMMKMRLPSRAPSPPSYLRHEKYLEAKAIAQVPQPIKPLEDSIVRVYVVPSYLTGKIEDMPKSQKEIVPLFLEKKPHITIKVLSNVFIVTPEERLLPVPSFPHFVSETYFLVRPKPEFDRGKHKLIFEFYQSERYLGLTNFDLEIGRKAKQVITFELPLEKPLKIHL